MKKLPVSKLKVSDIMTSKIITVTFGMKIEVIMNLFIQKQISGAPVVDDSNKLLSVVSESDLIRFAAMDNLDTQLIFFIQRLADQAKIRTAHPEDPFSTVYEQFLKTPYRRVPVINHDGVVVGIVSRRDIMNGFLTTVKQQ